MHYFICIPEGTSTFSSDAPFIFKKTKSQLYILSNKQYVQSSAPVIGAAVVTRSFVAILIGISYYNVPEYF